MRSCSCGGMHPDCLTCGGRGFTEDSTDYDALVRLEIAIRGTASNPKNRPLPRQTRMAPPPKPPARGRECPRCHRFIADSFTRHLRRCSQGATKRGSARRGAATHEPGESESPSMTLGDRLGDQARVIARGLPALSAANLPAQHAYDMEALSALARDAKPFIRVVEGDALKSKWALKRKHRK